jgi:hypothetical protein
MRRAVAVCLAGILSASTSFAQDRGQQQVEVKLLSARSGELDSTDVGVGGRLSWHPRSSIGLEGEVGFYPSNIPEPVAITSNRVEGLFGITAGPRLDGIRPFVRVRPGFLRVGAAPQPVPCIRIFPPPLSCTLAAGRTLLTVDLGGGVEVDTPADTFLRVDLGTRLVRYPGPAFDRNRHLHQQDFVGGDFRISLGAGWRF